MSENVLLVGATSAVARALAHRLARRGCNLVLAGRNREELDAIASDLRIRYQCRVLVESVDARKLDQHADFVDRAMGGFHESLQGAILCQGVLHDQELASTNWPLAHEMIDVNLTSCISLMGLLAERFTALGRGYLAAISSVAGERGRQSNFIYGATKAGLTAYLDGLRNRLHPCGVHVLTIKPGLIDTPMTRRIGKLPSRLTASAERVARDIDRAIRRRKNVLYTPWYWRGIMCVVRNIPEWLFKRLKM
jgi:short-subunit dehydrogenase